MVRIAVCDDDKSICAQMETILAEYSRQMSLKMEISTFFGGEGLLEYMRQGNMFDLVFLDIKLGAVNGVEVGRHIRKVFKNYSTEIVYISGNDGYDRQLFDVQPMHFISKPIDPSVVIDDLKLALERASRIGGVFAYQKGRDAYQIPVSEIIYFESMNREIRLVGTKGVDVFYNTLEAVQLSLSSYQFLRIHRSYLINYHHAVVLRYAEVVMSNDDVLPISRGKRQVFRDLQLDEV